MGEGNLFQLDKYRRTKNKSPTRLGELASVIKINSLTGNSEAAEPIKLDESLIVAAVDSLLHLVNQYISVGGTELTSEERKEFMERRDLYLEGLNEAEIEEVNKRIKKITNSEPPTAS